MGRPRRDRWGEACSFCKGYPPPEPQYCHCSLGHRLWRLQMRFYRWRKGIR